MVEPLSKDVNVTFTPIPEIMVTEEVDDRITRIMLNRETFDEIHEAVNYYLVRFRGSAR